MSDSPIDTSINNECRDAFETAVPIISVEIRSEHDVVSARQRARQIAESSGVELQDQARLATAISEITRNAFMYGKRARVSFAIDLLHRPQRLFARVADTGGGITKLEEILRGEYRSSTGMGIGIIGSKKLMDAFFIETKVGLGTTVYLGKNLGKNQSALTKECVARIANALCSMPPRSPLEEVQKQNRELIDLLAKLETRESELEQLNQELAETNRGVVALYAELDQKADSIQKVSDIKSSFLSNMTHEFRTPLSSILSLTRLLLNRLDGPLTEEQEKQVTFIRKSALGLLDTVNDLLDLAKVESGRISVNVTSFAVDEILGTLRGTFRPILSGNDQIELIIEDEAAGGLKLHSDEVKISQILRNLVSNAIKFTERGRITVSHSIESKSILFKVADTGIGIPLEHREVIFEEFAQIDSSLQVRSKGTGLGLPLSRKLARLLGGELWVDGNEASGSDASGNEVSGSIFYVRLPMVYAGQAEAEPSATDSLPSREVSVSGDSALNDSTVAHRVLIIDDDPASRYVLRDLLQSNVGRCQIVEAGNGEDGLKIAREMMPSAIFLDLNLAGFNHSAIDGVEVLRSLRADHVSRSIPVVVITARALTDTEYARLSENTSAVLSKDRSNEVEADKLFIAALRSVGLN